MKRGLLLGAIIITFILVPIYLFYGFGFLAIESLIEMQPDLADTVPAEYYELIKTIGGVLLVFALGNIIAGIRLLGARNDKISSLETTIWSIYLIISSFIIPGVLGILSLSVDNKKETSSLEMKLKEVDNLYHQGLITVDEYNQRRQALLDKTE